MTPSEKIQVTNLLFTEYMKQTKEHLSPEEMMIIYKKFAAMGTDNEYVVTADKIREKGLEDELRVISAKLEESMRDGDCNCAYISWHISKAAFEKLKCLGYIVHYTSDHGHDVTQINW